jgi:hypothetical protein
VIQRKSQGSCIPIEYLRNQLDSSRVHMLRTDLRLTGTASPICPNNNDRASPQVMEENFSSSLALSACRAVARSRIGTARLQISFGLTGRTLPGMAIPMERDCLFGIRVRRTTGCCLFPTPEFRRGSILGHDDWIAWSIRASDDSIAERAFSRTIGVEGARRFSVGWSDHHSHHMTPKQAAQVSILKGTKPTDLPVLQSTRLIVANH